MSPIRAMKVLEQWGQVSPDAACGKGLPFARDLREERFSLAVFMRCASYAAAPFLIAPCYSERSWARVSQELWSMPKSFRDAFRVSLNRFFLATLGACSSLQFSIQDSLRKALVRHPCDMPGPSQLRLMEHGGDAGHAGLFQDLCIRDFVLPSYSEQLSEAI